MFQHFNNIDSAFKHVRLFTFVIILAAISLCGYCMYFCMDRINAASQRIYLLINGKAYEAGASTRQENIPVEAMDHVETFHRYFFTLSPDDKAIQATITKSLYLADKSAKDAYDDLQENGFYTSLISGNVSQQLLCDSVQVSTNSYPYYFRFFGRQLILRSSAKITRLLITEGYLRNVDRTSNNSHGFLIEKWNTLQNVDLTTEKR